MDIYVVDERVGYWYQRTAEARPGPKQVLAVDHRWEIERICRRIRSLAPRGARVVYLTGHGHTLTTGEIEIGEGLTVETAFHFAQLRRLWVGAAARIEVHACYAASELVPAPRCRPNPDAGREAFRAIPARLLDAETAPIVHGQICVPGRAGPAAPGHAILQRVADQAGVDVLAGSDAQFADWAWSFEGPVQRYQPRVAYPMLGGEGEDHLPVMGRRYRPRVT